MREQKLIDALAKQTANILAESVDTIHQSIDALYEAVSAIQEEQRLTRAKITSIGNELTRFEDMHIADLEKTAKRIQEGIVEQEKLRDDVERKIGKIWDHQAGQTELLQNHITWSTTKFESLETDPVGRSEMDKVRKDIHDLTAICDMQETNIQVTIDTVNGIISFMDTVTRADLVDMGKKAVADQIDAIPTNKGGNGE